jgi:hypothetical protein
MRLMRSCDMSASSLGIRKRNSSRESFHLIWNNCGHTLILGLDEIEISCDHDTTDTIVEHCQAQDFSWPFSMTE